jgi:hypothetical protein
MKIFGKKNFAAEKNWWVFQNDPKNVVENPSDKICPPKFI